MLFRNIFSLLGYFSTDELKLFYNFNLLFYCVFFFLVICLPLWYFILPKALYVLSEIDTHPYVKGRKE